MRLHVRTWLLAAVSSVLTLGLGPAPREEPGIFGARDVPRRLAGAHERELILSLCRISGLAGLHFAADGALGGYEPEAAFGSATVRSVLGQALGSGMRFLVEDHSGSDAVEFGQLDEGTRVFWGPREDRAPLLVWRVRLDFRDFERIEASRAVRESFDPAFTLLHELLHGLGCRDGRSPGELGEVESVLNRAREELGLPIRDAYFAELLPAAKGRYIVRLPFRDEASEAAAQPRAHAKRAYLSFGVDAERRSRVLGLE